MSRFARQIRLAEVGSAGQARIAAARVAPGGEGFAREVEASYLRLAGAQVDGPSPSPPPVDLGIENPAAREVGEGALRALVALRRILGVGASEGGRA